MSEQFCFVLFSLYLLIKLFSFYFFSFRFVINPFFRLFRGVQTLTQRVFNIINGDSFLLILTNFNPQNVLCDFKLRVHIPLTTNCATEIFPIQEDLTVLENLGPEAIINDMWYPDFELDRIIQDLDILEMADFPEFTPELDLDIIIRDIGEIDPNDFP